MGLTLVAGPAVEPLDLEEVKRFLRITHAANDDDLDSLIVAGRQRCERVSDRALIEQTWRLTLDRWPPCEGWYGSVIRLPKPPLVSVSSITYVDTAGVTQTLDPSNYVVDSSVDPAEIVPAYATTWPPARPTKNAIAITFVAGYGATADDVPTEIRERIKNYVAYCYEKPVDRDEEFLDRLFAGFNYGACV